MRTRSVHGTTGEASSYRQLPDSLRKLVPHLNHASCTQRLQYAARRTFSCHFVPEPQNRGGTTLGSAQTSSTRDTFFPGALPHEPGTGSLGMPNPIGRKGRKNATSGRTGRTRRVEVERGKGREG